MRQILLVEDEVDSREALARALTRAGYTCFAVESADEARVAAARETDLDAAVLDVKLGADDLAGVLLVKPLREAFPGIAVVVITAFANLDTVKRALNDGAAYLMEKPFASAELLAVLARVLAERNDTSHLVERCLRRAKLTEKEAEVARLVLKGLPSAEVADVLHISDKTVRQHLSQVYTKCGVTSRSELFHHVFPS
jgi:DNA-binding NarL/FixJ family response regulator